MLARARVAGYLIVALVAVVQFVILPIRQRNRRMAEKVQRLEEENGQLSGENAKLAARIEALTSDPYYVEYLLRSRFRYRRPGEVRVEPKADARSRHGSAAQAVHRSAEHRAR